MEAVESGRAFGPWLQFTSRDNGPDWYTRSVFNVAAPYAVLRSFGRVRGCPAYAVVGARSIDDATVICDDVLRAEPSIDLGLRVYLLSHNWMCQVHYVGREEWPSHEECVRRVAWDSIETTGRLQRFVSLRR
jgi:hypothetical protein